ncbi:phosphotransferase family protein [Microbacterium sp. NPDC028030]|uniref:phosphotransferase family protein n=1 Tax=Microbacterium sp. NPDC028030 TaxID=3155124 RepID=UPI0033E176AB
MSAHPTDRGLRPDAVSAWFAEHIDGASGPLTFAQIAGGRSNLTYLVQNDSGARWVLRRAPLGMGDSRSHDVLREAGVLTRLAPTPVPVPAVAGRTSDDAITGAPFYVMEHIDGVVLRDPAAVESAVTPPRRRAFAASLVSRLADLHAVDPRDVGWGELAERDDYLSRQLGRWHANWAADRVRVLDDIGRAHDRLRELVPAQTSARIVHGDYRIDNCVYGPDGSIRAVLDWELTTVGDPLADLGQLLTYWAEPDDEVRALQNPPTLAPGFPTREELIGMYVAAAPSTDVSRLDFHVAYNWWKVACIVENVYTRMARGAMGASDRPPASFAAQAERIAAEAWRLTREL